MKVIFGIALPDYKVISVMWLEPDGINEVTLLSDGSARQQVIAGQSLWVAMDRYFSSHAPCVVAELPGKDVALKYLGKKSHLVELLPTAELLPGE